MDKALLAGLSALISLFLAACGGDDGGLPRALVHETPAPTRLIPTPAAVPMGLASPLPGQAESQQAPDSGEEGPAADGHLVRVLRGDLATSISINGTIAFPNTKTVVVEVEGILGTLAVEEGQTVTAGQTVAHMDRATVTALEEALAQARFDALLAEDALASALAPHDSLETDRAEAEVARAVEALRSAEESRLSLLRPTEHEMAAAEAVLADNRLKVDALRAEIDSLVRGPNEKELEHLQVHVRSDEVVLENALRGETLAEEEWEVKIGRASREIKAASKEYRDFFLKWLGIEAHHVDATLSPDHLLNEWGADLESLFAPDRVDLMQLLATGGPANDPDTPWNELSIWAYRNLVPFEVRVDCGGAESSIEVFCLIEEMGMDWDSLLDRPAAISNPEQAGRDRPCHSPQCR